MIERLSSVLVSKVKHASCVAAYCLSLGATGFAQDRIGRVSLIYPLNADLDGGPDIRLKAVVEDPNRSIVKVQFLANTNVIGEASQPPYTVIWPAGRGLAPRFGDELFGTITAVAVDRSGNATSSSAVLISVLQSPPPRPHLEITSPRSGASFLSRSTVEFAAELLASVGSDPASVEFYVDTNFVGSVTQPANTTRPFSLGVSNLIAGEYEMSVKYLGIPIPPVRVTIADLLLNSIRLSDAHIEFEVISAFPDKPIVVEVSTNLGAWTAISTSLPPVNAFIVSVPHENDANQRFYRAVIRP